MAAVMGGTMRAPLTGVIFALELTYDVRALLPLLIAATIAHAFTVLILKRSILTEKIARRGHHVSQEFSVDPLELLSVSEVMTNDPIKVPASLTIKELLTDYFFSSGPNRHKGYPVVDKEGHFLGIVTRSDVLEQWMAHFLRNEAEMDLGAINAYDLVNPTPVSAYPWESCRTAAQRMAQRGVSRLPVVSPDDPQQLVGIITLSDLLKPRARQANEEVVREQFFGKNLLRRRVKSS
jgi:CBS domain-containing protein